MRTHTHMHLDASKVFLERRLSICTVAIIMHCCHRNSFHHFCICATVADSRPHAYSPVVVDHCVSQARLFFGGPLKPCVAAMKVDAPSAVSWDPYMWAPGEPMYVRPVMPPFPPLPPPPQPLPRSPPPQTRPTQAPSRTSPTPKRPESKKMPRSASVPAGFMLPQQDSSPERKDSDVKLFAGTYELDVDGTEEAAMEDCRMCLRRVIAFLLFATMFVKDVLEQ